MEAQSISIQEMQQLRRDAEEKIQAFITSEVNDFQKKSGVSVDSISVSVNSFFIESQKEPISTVADVSIKVSL